MVPGARLEDTASVGSSCIGGMFRKEKLRFAWSARLEKAPYPDSIHRRHQCSVIPQISFLTDDEVAAGRFMLLFFRAAAHRSMRQPTLRFTLRENDRAQPAAEYDRR
jgi:hypothetical protein